MKLFKFILVVLTVLSVSSCMKDTPQFDFEARLAEEKIMIREYVAENYPNAIESTEYPGIWYDITSEGESGSYTYRVNDNINQLIIPTITTRYKVKLLNGTQVDENQSEAGWSSKLNEVIPAWQIAFLPKSIDEHDLGGLTESGLQKGAELILITPSYYAYANQQRPNIPANSPLVFQLEVLDIED